MHSGEKNQNYATSVLSKWKYGEDDDTREVSPARELKRVTALSASWTRAPLKLEFRRELAERVGSDVVRHGEDTAMAAESMRKRGCNCSSLGQ